MRLRIENDKLQMLKDSFDELVAQFEERIQKMWKEVRAVVHIIHEEGAAPRALSPQVMSTFDECTESTVITVLTDAVQELMRSNKEMKALVEKLKQQLIDAEVAHQRDMAELKALCEPGFS